MKMGIQDRARRPFPNNVEQKYPKWLQDFLNL